MSKDVVAFCMQINEVKKEKWKKFKQDKNMLPACKRGKDEDIVSLTDT